MAVKCPHRDDEPCDICKELHAFRSVIAPNIKVLADACRDLHEAVHGDGKAISHKYMMEQLNIANERMDKHIDELVALVLRVDKVEDRLTKLIKRLAERLGGNGNKAKPSSSDRQGVEGAGEGDRRTAQEGG